MHSQWTQRARQQFLAIIDSVSRLATFPEMGRRGRVGGTRELVIPSQPYIVAYRIQGQTIHILAVLHGARKWPEQF